MTALAKPIGLTAYFGLHQELAGTPANNRGNHVRPQAPAFGPMFQTLRVIAFSLRNSSSRSGFLLILGSEVFILDSPDRSPGDPFIPSSRFCLKIARPSQPLRVRVPVYGVRARWRWLTILRGILLIAPTHISLAGPAETLSALKQPAPTSNLWRNGPMRALPKGSFRPLTINHFLCLQFGGIDRQMLDPAALVSVGNMDHSIP
jgi:hypothetical protein